MNHGIEITERDENWMKDDLTWIILEQYLDISGCSWKSSTFKLECMGFSWVFLALQVGET